ncbi:MAG: transketolase [Clostridia bacterium]|jgi:transketolase|nr:transketolase [Clostridia bacterium]MCI1998992.1 transketolase [Clostridia bacterium]MCI2013742.1 transketolase [Clostridia bacterium]
MDKDTLSVNTIRFLSVEAIQKAKSGHPGLPMDAAPAAFTLWSKEMKHNPKNPDWINRDRFILSAGHGSMMLYSLLHLFGYGTTIEDIKNFRQLDSKTPGHPEYGIAKGIETTTGPLGQGIANAVGFAMAESHLAAEFNKPGYEVIDHYTFVLCGDGCLMEGVSSEAASLAGTLGLGKLILIYDSNNITIEGSTKTAFAENVRDRFKAYGWQTLLVEDGNDLEEIDTAIKEAKAETNKPTIIEIKTIIGYGAPNKQGKASAHGEPLGDEEIALTKENLGWEYKEEFYVPEEVKENCAAYTKKGEEANKAWDSMFKEYCGKYPEMAKKWDAFFSDKLPVDLLNSEDFWTYEGDLATRASSEKVLNKLSKLIPNLFGGSADLGPSNKSVMKDREYYSKENPSGSNIHFGIREFAMTAMANAFALHGGLRPYIAGFFVFSDYMKAGLRLSALMKLPVISIFTHDSIGVGEDGPTHQPVEHLAALRSMPGYTVIRPCDSHETAAAWYLALTRKQPTGIVLSRQKLPLLNETGKGALKGAYILRDCEGTPDILLMATGSEVELIYKAYDVLNKKGIKARVISMPSFEVFEEQSDGYKESVIPNSVRKRLAVEAASDFGWYKYVGLDGKVISMKGFGASAPADKLFEKFGFTVENVVNTALEICSK